MTNARRKIALYFSGRTDQMLLSEHLSGLGYEVLAPSKEPEAGPDLFIMDAPSARRVGKAALKLKSSTAPFLPVIVALSSTDEAASFLPAGFDHCLHMPVSKSELDAVVKVFLRLREQSELIIAQAQNIYQAIFEATGTATMIVEEDGTIVMANRECLPVTGYTSEELIGRKWMENVAPESLEMMRKYHALRRKDPSLAPKKYEARLINKKGESRWAVLDVGMIPGTSRSVVSMVDITERKQAEEALRRLSEEFHALLDAIPDNLTLQDKDLNVLWANKGAAAGIGKKSDELFGRRCYALWHGRSEPCRPCPVLESYETGEPAAATVTTPDSRIWELRTVPIKEAGRVVNVIEMGRDVTEHRRLEAQYLHAQKMEVVGQLAGGVAHDFNNILSAIVGYGHIALMKIAQDNPARLDIEQMLAASDRAAHLTKELLLFSRKQAINRQPVDLNDIVKRLEKFLRRVIREDIALETSFCKGPLPMLADSHQIEQVLMNLATNARDAMPEGGLFTVSTERTEIGIDFVKSHGYGKPGAFALLTVSDTGTGMDKETLKRIFEPFFTTKEVGKGTGLGMSVVYGIIKQHEGFINVYSEPGKGTTFKIYLPLSAAEAQEKAPAADAQAQLPRGTETVLLAEDDDALRRLAVLVLSEYGYTVIEAVDGADAVRKFAENKDRVQLLLFDLVMPNMGGKDAYDEIRKQKPDVKVIFASGYAPDIVHQRVKLDKDAALLFKPLSPAALLREVRNVLDRK